MEGLPLLPGYTFKDITVSTVALKICRKILVFHIFISYLSLYGQLLKYNEASDELESLTLKT